MAKKRESESDTPEALDVLDQPGLGRSLGSPDAKADDLLEYLRISGTPVGTLRPLKEWLQEDKESTAADLYAELERREVTLGTRRKAGKWTFGRTYEPEDAVKLAPAEEMLRLRSENDQLGGQVAEYSARMLGLTQQNTHLHRRVAELQTQVQILSGGRSPAELDALGLNAPVQ